MPINFDDLEAILNSKISEGRTNPIGYGGGDLTGVSVMDAQIGRSPCRALRWLRDNSPYTYQTFVELSDEQGWQGVRIFNKSDGSLVREVKVPMGGGSDSDPMVTIYRNNKAIIAETMAFITENQGG
jgi:hypothetical protein